MNGRKVDIPSFTVKPNDVIEVREKSKKNPTILHARDATAHAPSPNWLEVDRENLKGRVLTMPRREDLVQIQLMSSSSSSCIRSDECILVISRTEKPVESGIKYV